MVDGNSNEPVVRHSNVQSRTSASSSTLNRRVSLPSVYSIIDTKPNEELLRNQFWYERGYLAARRQNGGDSFGRTPHAPPLFDGATETFELTPTPTGTEEESPSDGMQYRQMSSWVDRSPSPIRHQQQEKLYKNNDRAADIREDSSGDLHNNVQRLKPAHEIHSRNENHRYIDDEEHDKDQGHARTASGQPRVSEGTRTVLREILEPTVNQPPTFPHHKVRDEKNLLIVFLYPTSCDIIRSSADIHVEYALIPRIIESSCVERRVWEHGPGTSVSISEIHKRCILESGLCQAPIVIFIKFT